MIALRYASRASRGSFRLFNSYGYPVRSPAGRLVSATHSSVRTFKSVRENQAEVASIEKNAASSEQSSHFGSLVQRPKLEFKNFQAEYAPAADSWELTAEHDSKPTTISRRWLRDHCQCSECIHPATKQRLFEIFKAHDLRIKECVIRGDSAVVIWEEGGHKSEYSLEWLARAFDAPSIIRNRRGPVKILSWGSGQANIRNNPPEVKYGDVMNTNEGLAEWTRKIREVGFCFVDGCPPDPQATEALLERLGPIRNTHYGAFWDFTSNLASKDTAYTDLGLDVHTDTTYFTEAAGLQLFHLLSHEGEGGGTQLVDGFGAATKLQETHPWAHKILAEVELLAHASGNEGLSIQPHVPFRTINYDEMTGEYVQVRWNNSDRASIIPNPLRSQYGIDDWYKAASEWDAILQDISDETRYEVQLVPGRPLIFDNWRVLHGRSAFTGKRRMCGGYINMDDFISCYKTTNFGYDNILRSGIY